jgi:predicted ATPase/DNA-binding CsgD family transcriptional regulator/predicted enzyme related to lactoylglutathione lyase
MRHGLIPCLPFLFFALSCSAWRDQGRPGGAAAHPCHHGTRHGLRHGLRHGAAQVPAAGHVRENETVSSQASAAAGISAREAEVLTLVAQHLSNAEIGARLFISVRTVETHVSSLLRKLGVPDRRGLAQLAAQLAAAERSGAAVVRLPSPVTPLIGRMRERAALGEAIKLHRQVTAVGPGGVGKTRLALAVAAAAAAAGDFDDGAWFIDLVPITDPAMVGAAVATALGVGVQQGRGVDASVLAALADRHALLVLDNCEHLREGVTPFVERLLAGCPRLTVLATSRARLMVPFERVYEVPPLSLVGGGESDAVALFVDRAAAVGWPLEPWQHDQVAELCRELDGIALAIELAAARLPALGLDGLAAGLADHLRLLVGGSRADDRHRSVRTMLDWSYALLETADRTLLRRISVFMAPFTAGTAAEVAGFAPLAPGAVADGLARLAERSLLAVAPSAKGTRYRTLEAIRQYGMERLGEAGDLAATQGRHLRWCLASAAEPERDRNVREFVVSEGIQTVIYPVRDLDAAKDVFAQLTGRRPDYDQPYIAGWKLGGQDIALDPNGHKKGMTGPTAYWHVADIEQSLQALLDHGATVNEEVKDVGGGRLVGSVKDADGNVIGLLQDT